MTIMLHHRLWDKKTSLRKIWDEAFSLFLQLCDWISSSFCFFNLDILYMLSPSPDCISFQELNTVKLIHYELQEKHSNFKMQMSFYRFHQSKPKWYKRVFSWAKQIWKCWIIPIKTVYIYIYRSTVFFVLLLPSSYHNNLPLRSKLCFPYTGCQPWLKSLVWLVI